MELISKTTIGNKTLSLVDVSGSNGGKWKIPRLFRVVETEGDYIRLNSKNVLSEHFLISYDARSKKARAAALSKAIEEYADVLKEFATDGKPN
jgi:hypothetical protein